MYVSPHKKKIEAMRIIPMATKFVVQRVSMPGPVIENLGTFSTEPDAEKFARSCSPCPECHDALEPEEN